MMITMTGFAALDLHISLASETVFTIGNFPVTNALLTGCVGLLIFFAGLLYAAGMLRHGRYNRFVGLVQWGFEGMYSQIESVIPDKRLARKIAPLAMTIFFFVLVSYWLSVLPGFGSVTLNDAPLFRSLTADLNFTLGLALIAMVTVQIFAVSRLGFFGNVRRYFRNPIKDPIGFFEGFLELIGEISRGTALALRLFGNAFAGEILLLIIAVLTGYFATVTLPIFMAFELFIGFIQAYVFFMLTLIFTALATGSHVGSADSEEHSTIGRSHTSKQEE